MVRQWLVSLGLVLLLAVAAQGVTFNHVVTLGDSLLDDTDNSRSPVAAEHVANRLGVGLTKLAVSGSTSDDLIANGQHTQAAAQFGNGDLAMLWIGGNDFFDSVLGITFGFYGFLNDLEANVDTALSTLRGAGMEVVVFNLPDMSEVPVTLGISNFRTATLQWNDRLATLADNHGAHLVDVFSLFEDLNANPSDFDLLGHTPVLGPSSGCQYCTFADAIHPSSFAQGYIANIAFEVLNSAYDPQGAMPLEDLSIVELALLADLLAGDFNENDLVDGSDLSDWSTGFGMTTAATHFDGDADGDGDVAGSDFLIWQQQAGSSVALSVPQQAVPEPASGVLVSAGILLVAIHRRKR